MTVRWATIPRPYSFPSPRTGFQRKSRSQVPTLRNKLEADFTGTQPGDGPQRAGCTCAPPVPSAPRRGRGAASLPSPPGAGRERGGVSGEVQGLTFGAPGQPGQTQTPTSGRNRRSRTRVSPPFRLGGGRREERAPGGAGGRLHGLSSRRAHRPRPRRPRRPPGQLPKAERSSGPEGSEAGAQPGPARRPLRPFSPPSPRVRGRSLRSGRGVGGRTPASRRRARARLPPAQPGPGPGAVRTHLGGQPGPLGRRARLRRRREVAASPAAGAAPGRGGGARRPGPYSRGPARGGHLEARRRSRGTPGGGSGGERSSST